MPTAEQIDYKILLSSTYMDHVNVTLEMGSSISIMTDGYLQLFCGSHDFHRLTTTARTQLVHFQY